MAAPGEPPSIRRLIFPGVFVLLLFAFLVGRRPAPEAPASPPTASRTLSGRAFGTTYTIRWIGNLEPASVEAAVTEVVASVNRSMSTYHPDSELSRFNRLGAGTTTVSKALAEVLAEAQRLHALTGGAFDPTVGPLVNAWGFGPDEVVEPPTEAALAAARTRVGFDKLSFDSGELGKSAGVEVDLSAIAKGYAVDEVAEALSALGSSRHLVEIGGEIRALGEGTRGPWTVGIERPEPGAAKTVFEVLKLREAGFATSGNYRNFVLSADGRTVTHIIDPRTGDPVSHGLGSVSVLHPRCATADALATALYVLGPDEGLAWAESHGVAALFLTAREGRIERRPSSAYTRLAAAAGPEPKP